MTKWLRWARVLICIPPVMGLFVTLGVNEYSLSAAAITVRMGLLMRETPMTLDEFVRPSTANSAE